MKIWITLTYHGEPIDAREKTVTSNDAQSRQIEIEIKPLIDDRLDALVQNAKRRLQKKFAELTQQSKGTRP